VACRIVPVIDAIRVDSRGGLAYTHALARARCYHVPARHGNERGDVCRAVARAVARPHFFRRYVSRSAAPAAMVLRRTCGDMAVTRLAREASGQSRCDGWVRARDHAVALSAHPMRRSHTLCATRILARSAGARLRHSNDQLARSSLAASRAATGALRRHAPSVGAAAAVGFSGCVVFSAARADFERIATCDTNRRGTPHV